jgi:hypothetical protein
MTNAHRVILNSAALYARVVVTTVLVLFTSRYILAALGVVDFGLYSVVAGIMGFMGFLNSAMATSSQLHLTHKVATSSRSTGYSTRVSFCIPLSRCCWSLSGKRAAFGF